LVRPDANHEVDARGKNLLIGFVDPQSALGNALTERIKVHISWFQQPMWKIGVYRSVPI
jgi:hypothetical protein